MDQADLLRELRIDRDAAPPRASRRWWRWLGGALIALGLLAAGAWFVTRGAVSVELISALAVPTDSPRGAVLDATGYVVARREATVSAQITGTLVDVLIEEGEHVEAGQVLAHLEDTAQQAALRQAQAALAATRAQLAQFQAELAQSRRDLVRAEDLAVRKLVSAQSVELARTRVATQAAQAETQRRQVGVAEAVVSGAQVQVDYCTVRAPFAGVVIAKAAQVGEIVSPLSAGGGFTRTGIGTIVDMDSLEIEVDVNEAYIHRVSAGQPTEAVLDAYADWKIPGHVIAIIPTADRSKATVKVRVALDRRDARIVPDMGVRVSFLEAGTAAAEQALQPRGVLVPATAVVSRDGREVVFVVADGRALARPVSAAEAAAGQREVAGLEPGTRVVRSVPKNLEDGARVRLNP